MRRFLLVFTAIITLQFVFAQNQAAIAYNDKIVQEQSKIAESILHFSTNPNEFALSQIKNQAEAGLNILNDMKPFEGNKEFLNAAKKIFKFYISIADNEYKKMLDLISHADEYTESALTQKAQELTESLSKKEKPLDAKFQTAQVAFAKKYGFKLTKNEVQERLESDEEE